MKTTAHPENLRAIEMIERAVTEIEQEGGCIHSFASAALVQAATLYAYVHGATGPEGAANVLQRLADIHHRHAAVAEALADHGQTGRA